MIKTESFCSEAHFSPKSETEFENENYRDCGIALKKLKQTWGMFEVTPLLLQGRHYFLSHMAFSREESSDHSISWLLVRIIHDPKRTLFYKNSDHQKFDTKVDETLSLFVYLLSSDTGCKRRCSNLENNL